MKRIVFITASVAVVALFVAGAAYVSNRISPNTLIPGMPNLSTAKGETPPEFPGGRTWLNSDPLTIAGLKGKVVLIDFWTYSCINCIRTLPYVTKWYDEYKDLGFVVIGVHTPEFAFEQDTQNVRDAIARFNIKYPVVQDNDYAIWGLYDNHYWPAEYLIDQNGEIVERHIGEGEYLAKENSIRRLLGLPELTGKDSDINLKQVRSPEMYFGASRLDNLEKSQSPSAAAKNYSANVNPDLNRFSLGGEWSFSPAYAELQGDKGEINLKFHSANLFFVAESRNPVALKITVDGVPQPDVTVQSSQLYQLYSSNDYSDHTIRIEIDGAGLKAYTFTFG